MNLKPIDFTKKVLPANGKTYYIEESISYGRWKEYRKHTITLPLDMGFDTLFNHLLDGYNKLNKKEPDILGCGIVLHNLMNGIKNIMDEKNIPVVLKMCALFINEENEDRSVITEQMIESKVADWAAEGYDMGSFFTLAVSLIPDFLKNYDQLTQSTSEGVLN